MKRLSILMERLTRVALSHPADFPVLEPDPVVVAELESLRTRLNGLTGSLVSSSDGLVIAHDLPPSIEPSGVAALSTSELALSHRLIAVVHGGDFDEVVIRGDGGYVVVYSAGSAASLTVLAGSNVNVGRLHLESRPTARNIAGHLDAMVPPHRDDSQVRNRR